MATIRLKSALNPVCFMHEIDSEVFYHTLRRTTVEKGCETWYNSVSGKHLEGWEVWGLGAASKVAGRGCSCRKVGIKKRLRKSVACKRCVRFNVMLSQIIDLCHVI